MPIEVGIWRIDGGPVRRVDVAGLEAERRLEDVLTEDASILGLPPLLVPQQGDLQLLRALRVAKQDNHTEELTEDEVGRSRAPRARPVPAADQRFRPTRIGFASPTG